ncbi:MAG: DUF3373 family protein [Proteobacteria bacterium]|nr:DUF3373 family protein [Desulfobacula sp.]MBU3951716.1 DUF3373 family protein [Pseudomonadota bacterium]MBU4131688.1 DUF3373 family protein [Pseudomonadota bacterium]
MKKKKPGTRKVLMSFWAGLFLMAMLSPTLLWADTEVDALKKQLSELTEMMQNVEKKLAEMEEKSVNKATEIKEMDERLNEAEMHTSTDKLSLGIELRSRADSIHYEDMLSAPPALMGAFFTPYTGAPGGGFNGATAAQIQAGMAGLATSPLNVPVKNDIDNDILYTSRFRMEMKAKINPSLSFGGRMAVYKVWGDSSGVQNYQGGMSDVTLDGTTSSLPNDDSIHLERAYFNYKNAVGDVPVNFSLGRRPSTEGPPLEYGNYDLEGGSPMAHLINWQFDGASLSMGLEEVTGITGSAFKLCYGVGFESDWGNSNSLTADKQLDDVHLFGFIADLFNNETTSAVLNYAHAFDITDGFTGQTVMPFTASVNPSTGAYTFAQNTGGFISRTEPTTNLGDWDAATLLLRTNLMEQTDKDIDLFLSFGWSHTSPDQTSAHPFYNLLGYGLLNSNGSLEDRDGYSVYAGAIFPMPFDARLGFEYNWGSQYWFNFTGAEDSLVDSKLAARGQVLESYYIQPIFTDNFFVKLGARYYDYDYTGSGNPLGEPVKISAANSMDTLFPVVDKVWNAYLSATVRF